MKVSDILQEIIIITSGKNFTFLPFYLQLYINHREFLALKKIHLHHPYNTETWLRISCSQFSLIQRWHISLPVAPTVALVSNGNKLSWQWQVILLLPLGPVGKIPSDAPRGMFLSNSLNLQPEPEWKDCRITLIQCGTTPDWQKLWEHAHQTLAASRVMCQHNITLNIFLVFLNMIYRLGRSSKNLLRGCVLIALELRQMVWRKGKT